MSRTLSLDSTVHEIVKHKARLGCVILIELVITDRMPQSGKLPVLNLLTGQKSAFLPCRSDLLHRFM